MPRAGARVTRPAAHSPKQARGKVDPVESTLRWLEDKGATQVKIDRGVYEPRMIVAHRVPRERLTKSYFRRWHRGYGRSMALVDQLHPKPVRYWLGVPRFLIRRAAESLPRMIAARLRGDAPGAFEQELNLWFMLGFVGGKLSSSSPEPAPNVNHVGEAREYDCEGGERCVE